MDTGDTTPLLTNDDAAAEGEGREKPKMDDSQKIKNMVIFHGKVSQFKITDWRTSVATIDPLPL